MDSSIIVLFIFIIIILLCILSWIILFDKNILLCYCVYDTFDSVRNIETHTEDIDYNNDVERFYSGAPHGGKYIKFLSYISKQVRGFISRPELKFMVCKTIVFDIDDTLVYTRPFHHSPKKPKKHPKYGYVTHYDGIGPIVGILKYAQSIGYRIIIITARPPESYNNSLSNLEELGIKPDALFTSLYWGQDQSFKAVMRNNIEHLTLDEIKNMSSRELFEYQPSTIMKNPLNLKVVMSIGDRWGDVVGMKDSLGLKLPEVYDMNGYFIFNGETRLIM